MLLVSAVLFGIACIQCGHSLVTAASETTDCPPKYPVAQLSNSCVPVPPWCKRLRGHGARNWYPCRPHCRAFLHFGEHRYRVVNWSDTKEAKVPVFSLALSGWRSHSFTIWRGKLYSRQSGSQGGAWQTVYLVDDRLVAVRAGAKPPFNCRKHSSGGGKHSGGQWKQLHGSCHGNKCIVKLSLSRLMQKAALLRQRGSDRGRKPKVELQFVLAFVHGRAQLVTGVLHLVATHSHRGQVEQGEDPSKSYKRFLAERREKFWRKNGWKSGNGQSDAGAKNIPREPKTAEKTTRNQQRENHARSREQRKSVTAQSEDPNSDENELKHMLSDAFKG